MPTVRRASVQENRSTCSLRSRSSSNEYIVRLLGGWTEVTFAFSFCSFVAIGSVHESAANKRLENPQGENLFRRELDRKSTRLNSSHTVISYAVFCLKKKKALVDDVTADLIDSNAPM